VLNMVKKQNERTRIFLPVLNPTMVDGTPITREFIEKYGSGLRGKSVNLDHNFDEKGFVASNIAIGDVSNVFYDPEGNLYSQMDVFNDVYGEIKEEIEGCSFEWNPNPSGTDGIMRGIALCRYSTPKVEFARSKPISEVFASIMNQKQSDNMIDVSKLTDEEKKELANALLPQVKELLASEMKPGEGEGEGEQKPEAKPEGESAPQENALAEVMKSIDTSLKTLIKSSEATQQQVGILASTMKPKTGGNPPAGGGNNDPPAHRSANLGL